MGIPALPVPRHGKERLEKSGAPHRDKEVLDKLVTFLNMWLPPAPSGATALQAREQGSGPRSTGTAQLFYFGASDLAEAVGCHIDVAAFLEAGFPGRREKQED